MSNTTWWVPDGPSRQDVQDTLLRRSRFLADLFGAELTAAKSADTRFLLATLGQLLVQQEDATRMYAEARDE